MEESVALQQTLFENSNSLAAKHSPTSADEYAAELRARCPKKRNSPKVLSLFSGAGGLDIGFSDAGFSIVEKLEIEDTFCDTLRANSRAGGQFKKILPLSTWISESTPRLHQRLTL